ncbi:MAG: PAS domain S-box protein, partial [Candidatus Methylomirabilales bacterium]
MPDDAKAKEQLLLQLVELRNRIAELEALEAERSRGEEALRAAKEYAENLINSSLDMIISVDLNRNITEFNRAAEEAFGYAKEEVLGRPVNLLYANPTEGSDIHAGTLEGGQFKGEITNRKRNGETFYSYLSAALMREAEGKVVGLMGISRDITDRKQAETALQKAHQALEQRVEERTAALRTINESLQHEIAQRKRADEILKGQREILEMVATGCPLREALDALSVMIERLAPGTLCSVLLLDEAGQHLFHGSAPSLPQEYIQAVNGIAIGPRAGSCGTAVYRNETVIVEDTEIDPLWADYRTLARTYGLRACWSVPIRDSSGVRGTLALYDRRPRHPSDQEVRLVGAAAHLAGIAIERKQAEASLQFTQFAIDRAGDAAFWLDSQARFFYVNDAACRSLGYSREELLSMTVHDIDPCFPSENWADHWREIRQRRSYTFESCHRTKDGRTFPVEITVNYLEFGGKGYHCAFARDITERKRAEGALRDSEERYRALYEDNPAMYFTVDPRGIVLSVNQFGAEQLGYTVDELVGESVF